MKPKIFYRYLNEEASEKEIQKLFQWIDQSQENKNQFIKLKQAWAVSSQSMVGEKDAWNSLKKKLFRKENNSYNWLKYAAVFAVFIGISSFLYHSREAIDPDSNSIVLESTNGFTTEIDSDKFTIVKDQNGNKIAEQHEDEIIYGQQTNSSPIQPIYNTLKIPYGKTFKVTLSDGTRVHLNSGTIFTYPESFSNVGERKVNLSGEAFFEVTENKTQPFIVAIDNYKVEVLGTKFNVSAYTNDKNSSTVLVEGSVQLTHRDNSSITANLKPNDKGVWNELEQKFEVTTVDSYIHTAWTQGELVFDHASFDLIMKKLERSLNVSIVNNNPNLAHQQFTGTLKIKDSDIETILDLLKIDTLFDYDIKGNQVIIHDIKNE